jgi:hypothetical protein
MKTIAAPATMTAEMLSKVNGSATVKAYVESFNNVSYIQRAVFQGFKTGYIVRATSFAMQHICKNAGFQADPIEVHDETFGDATWHIYRPVAA